jgi:hypothetical protein
MAADSSLFSNSDGFMQHRTQMGSYILPKLSGVVFSVVHRHSKKNRTSLAKGNFDSVPLPSIDAHVPSRDELHGLVEWVGGGGTGLLQMSTIPKQYPTPVLRRARDDMHANHTCSAAFTLMPPAFGNASVAFSNNLKRCGWV